jgi:hypothetical protein
VRHGDLLHRWSIPGRYGFDEHCRRGSAKRLEASAAGTYTTPTPARAAAELAVLAVVCPRCRSNLKAPILLAGMKARCPRCRALLIFRRPRPASPAAETAESAALDATAVQSPVWPGTEEGPPEPEPTGHRPGRPLLRAAVVVFLALAGAFALCMAVIVKR